MINPDKLPNALYALQGVLIRARLMATRPDEAQDLASLLDYAEDLPRMMAKSTDETGRFRIVIEEIAERYKCAFVLQRFDEKTPTNW